jgi:hypothetical protein
MARCYIESRKSAARGTESVAADAMRHLYARQHLGKAVVVTDTPVPMLSAARKQWLKLARTIQKQRSSTLNADKILKYTHMITRMQHMHFSAKSPMEHPEADVYFLQPHEVAILPIHCWTVYVLTPLSDSAAQSLLRLIPTEALVVDYHSAAQWERLGLSPKHALEQLVGREWRRATDFLRSYDVDVPALARHDIHDVEAMDEALDTLLGISHKFLLTANEFQRALELARPIRLSREVRAQYDLLVLLAHRVQALSPGAFTQQFLEVYNEDDTFFLYDIAREATARQRKHGAAALRLLPGLLPPVSDSLRRLGVAAYANAPIRERIRLQFDQQYAHMPNAYKPKLAFALMPKRTG